MRLQKILVAIKPWERGLPLAAGQARQLAQTDGAQILLMSTAFDAAVAASHERGDAAAVVTRERIVTAARVELERLASGMRARRAPVATRIVWGVPPYEAILAAAAEWRADLLVVGARDVPSAHTRLTDTDWQLMRRAQCPVLFVKGASFDGYKTIVAAVDAPAVSDEALAVLDAARCFAREPGATVYADAAHAAVETAARRRAQLVVVGAAQRSGRHASPGEAAESVAGQATCDVLVVPVAAAQLIPRQRSEVG